MKTDRKFFLFKTLILTLIIQNTITATEKKDEKKVPTAMKCNQDILRSYLLKGRKFSKPDQNLLCPTIKNNCCGKLDQQRIYHIVNDILPQRTAEYESKMKMAIGKLKILHTKVIKKKPLFIGSPKRKLFCGQQSRKLVNFPFVKLYQKLITEIENLRYDMDEYYNTFFCVMCDAKNHKFIELKQKKLIMNSEFCQNILKNNMKPIKLLYVELIAYLENLQNVVDCHHYLKSYNLKFFENSKMQLSHDLGSCLNNITSKSFLKYCKPICEVLQVSKINYIIEGDFEFLIDATNLFDKFFEFKESGNFISMKLRMFFKKFTIPRKLTNDKRKQFIAELKDQQDQEEARSEQRKLTQIPNKSSNQTTKAVKNTILAHISKGRLLSAKKNKKPKKKKIKTARLIYNKELYHFYNEITITPPKEKQYVYHVASKPVDIDKLQKIFVKGDGINPLDYEGQTKFKIPHDLFYKLLFSFRKPDAPDANLLFFLTDFSEKNKKGLKLNLLTKFKMQPPPKKKKKKKGKVRILEDGSGVKVGGNRFLN